MVNVDLYQVPSRRSTEPSDQPRGSPCWPRRRAQHPDLEVGWGWLIVRLTTHSVGGLSRNDFIMAGRIDRLTGGSPIASTKDPFVGGGTSKGKRVTREHPKTDRIACSW
jgi:hypothetical protein